MPTEPMQSRRQFLGAIAVPSVAACLALDPRSVEHALAAANAVPGADGPPDVVARNEDFWVSISRAFTVDRTIVNLNNGGVSPSPAVVQAAMRRHLEYSNQAPSYTMWQILEPQRETVRQRIAIHWGCDPEEVAIVRNASEGLQTCQLGFDLERGDEVLTTTQDYGRMINTFKQRVRREGIVLEQFSIPVPCEDPAEIVARFAKHITSKTRLILVCHMINITGQILPVREVVALGRKHSIPVIVDGAHALAHFPFKFSDLDCDYYASSLHKWLFAPHGTGLLYVRRNKIKGLWPLMAAPEQQTDDIRKFEEIGTHPVANFLAIGDALTFHQGIGDERKAARLIYLRNYWAKRLMAHERIKLHTSLKPGFACGIATVQVLGIDSKKLATWLWDEQRIHLAGIKHPEFEGLRVSPSVYTTLEELDRFCAAIETVLEKGIG